MLVGVAEVPLGVVGVVETPLGDRCAGDRGVEQQRSPLFSGRPGGPARHEWPPIGSSCPPWRRPERGRGEQRPAAADQTAGAVHVRHGPVARRTVQSRFAGRHRGRKEAEPAVLVLHGQRRTAPPTVEQRPRRTGLDPRVPATGHPHDARDLQPPQPAGRRLRRGDRRRLERFRPRGRGVLPRNESRPGMEFEEVYRFALPEGAVITAGDSCGWPVPG